ncbi:MAG: gliding motility-associated C-terminal domain-containing protein [Chitinophagales bacterium]
MPNGFTAYSNEQCINSDVIESYEDDYIRAITINADNHIVIQYMKDTSATPPKKFVLQRSPDGITFTPVVITPFFQDSTQIVFVDGAANPSNNSFYYRVVTTDNCGAEHTSQAANTIHLTVEEDKGNTGNIEWNDFYTDSAQIINYSVYTYQDSMLSFFGSYGNNVEQAVYEDLFDYTADSITEICFMIIAEYYNLNDATPRQLLRNSSNIVCLKPTPKIFMPNAIAPQGVNKSIKPFLYLASDTGYSFKIFNRWHQMVFSTNNRDEAWYGDYKGEAVPMDAYIYYIEYQGVDGQQYTATGTLHLIR